MDCLQSMFFIKYLELANIYLPDINIDLICPSGPKSGKSEKEIWPCQISEKQELVSF